MIACCPRARLAAEAPSGRDSSTSDSPEADSSSCTVYSSLGDADWLILSFVLPRLPSRSSVPCSVASSLLRSPPPNVSFRPTLATLVTPTLLDEHECPSSSPCSSIDVGWELSRPQILSRSDSARR